MKYQLQPESAVLDNSGLTISAGWAVIYNVDSKGEFLQATYQYLPIGVGLPADAYLDAPKSVTDNQAIIHNGQQWIYPKDLRGTKIYSIETGAETTFQEVGEIPDGFTELKPASEFDSWDGEKWQFDKNKQHQYEVNQALTKKINFLLKQLRNTVIYKMRLIHKLLVSKKHNYSLNGKNIEC